MSPDPSDTEEKKHSSSSSLSNSDGTGEESPSREEIDSQDLHQLLGELRAEITRLKAHRARERAQNWIQRHPVLAVSLALMTGVSAGYGIALLRRTQPPTLSEQARNRLRQFVREARQVAGDVGNTLSTQAMQSGQEARRRFRESGKHLAQEVRRATTQQAEEIAEVASDQAQRLGTRAGEIVRRAVQRATKRPGPEEGTDSEESSEVASALADQAKKAIEESAESVQQAVPNGDATPSRSGTLWTLAGVAAGGYLASKVRQWF